MEVLNIFNAMCLLSGDSAWYTFAYLYISQYYGLKDEINAPLFLY